MLIRVRTKAGTSRVDLSDDITGKVLIDELKRKLALPDDGWVVSKQPTGAAPINERTRQPNLKHGDMLYITYNAAIGNTESGGAPPLSSLSSASQASDAGGSGTSAAPSDSAQSASAPAVLEDDIDQQLNSQDGLIRRKRDPIFCKHGANGMCDNCCPIEPYDAKYLEQNNIKHMSFHAYLKKLRSGADAGKFATLTEPQMAIKPGCTSHLPWPAGICTKCQPSAVTLTRQPYRHVDYVEFESSSILNKFIDFWRQSHGKQRLGILYGRYEQRNEAPLGIKAVVAAIYEPPQISEQDSLELLTDPNEKTVELVATNLGLRPVGWIFTDLEDDGTKSGKVQHKRHKDTFFLSASEIMMAADFQNKYPNPCSAAPSGYFGSKFVTVVVSGDANHEVSLEAYQVSNQCTALVKYECVVPSSRDPSAMTVKESSAEQYVPDVFYKYTNEYNSEISASAKPSFPVDYLLVSLGNGSPQNPSPMFGLGLKEPFAVENRETILESADVSALKKYLNQPGAGEVPFLVLASDFHFLLYLASEGVFSIASVVPQLLEAVRTRNLDAANAWQHCAEWQTAVAITEHVSATASHLNGAKWSDDQAVWTCPTCTYFNSGSRTSCEMCQTPKN